MDFGTVDKKYRLYAQQPAQRAGVPMLLGPGLLTRALQVQDQNRYSPVLVGRSFGLTHVAPTEAQAGKGNDNFSTSELHLRLAERIAPPSVVVNSEHEIVHLTPNAGRFLQLTGSDPSLNLLRVVHPMLRVELSKVAGKNFQSS